MKKQLLYLLAAVAVAATVFVTGCQKELSFEGSGTPAKGSLQFDVTGDCMPKTVNGIYSASAALVPATNTITVQVNVTQIGTYVVTTDTVNGYFFRATGTFTALGMTTVTLRGNGTPFAAGTDNFIVSFDGTICDIAVTVMPAGTGAAVFTLVSGGTPPNCASAVVSGTYTQNIALVPLTNYVDITVNVTTLGSYTITATGGGMIFSKSGAFTATGNQSVRLDGTGTPTVAGANTVTFAAPFASCSFTVTVLPGAGPAVFTLVSGGTPVNCASAAVTGTYTQNVALVAASNYVDITVNVSTIGSYTITATGGGMTFAKTGTFSTTGNQTVRLDGSGTPTGSGAVTVTFAAPFASCSFTVTVTPASSNCVCTLNGSPGNCATPTINGIYVVGGTLTSSHTVVLGVNCTTAGSYTVTTTTNGLTFSGSGSLALGAGSITLTASGSAMTSGNNSFTVSVNGSASCTFTIYVLPNDYYPRTSGSNWSFEFDNVATDSLYRTATANTHSAGGNTYTIFMQNDGTGLDSGGYYRRSGSDYFEWFDFGTWIGLNNPAWTQYTMLQEANAPGTPWTSGTISGVAGTTAISLRFQYQILPGQKNVPITITSSGSPTNVTYQDVIVVEERIWYSLDGGTTWQDATTVIDYYGKSYYARGIGLIKFEAFDASNVLIGQQELRRFQVF